MRLPTVNVKHIYFGHTHISSSDMYGAFVTLNCNIEALDAKCVPVSDDEFVTDACLF